MPRQIVVTESDLTGQLYKDDSDVVTIAVLQHPDLEEPVQLAAGTEEIKNLLDNAKKNLVFVEIISDGGDKRESLILTKDDFEAAFTVEDVQTVLEEADSYRAGGVQRQPAVADEPKRRGRPPVDNSKNSADKVNYKELPNAGMPHRGRTTDEEALIVRENLQEVNQNRIAAGHPAIDPQNEKDAARYGFDIMPVQDRPKLQPEFAS